jgi:plastocyanin
MQRLLFLLTMQCALCAVAKNPDAGVAASPNWIGSELPLQLAVRTPEDLVFKAGAERQYLLFNLLASGKQAWDQRQFGEAASRWEALLRTPNLPLDLEALVKPLARAARNATAGDSQGLMMLPVETVSASSGTSSSEKPLPVNSNVNVNGSVAGGGSHGPGGAVVMLRRTDGPTPKPRAARVKAMVQKNKSFLPHVLPVPLGSTVEFRNEDEIFHNVFSLTKPSAFDLGLYKNGVTREQIFASPGAVHLLCNIHASMNGWIVVSDSPWYGQADSTGRFTVRNVPPGQYEVEVWHEWSSSPPRQVVRVNAGMAELTLNVDGAKPEATFVPDKSGKPRQSQLGY